MTLAASTEQLNGATLYDSSLIISKLDRPGETYRRS